MIAEWNKAPLSALCEQIADCPHSTPVWTDVGALVLRSQNIRNGRLDLSNRSYTDELHFEQRSRRARLRGGDLVITREAPMGEVCLVPEGLRCCLGQRMVMLRPDQQKCDSRFLLYALQSDAVQYEIKVNEGTGSTVSNLRIPLLEALQIPHPPLAEQKAIAAILGALDDKIELNRRMNATLEAIARALFRSWFLDFDPVRAKLDGRVPVGMDLETAAMFPDAFQDSESAHIPSGWRVMKVVEFIERRSVGQKYEQKTVSSVGKFPVLDQGKSGVIGFHNNEPGVTATLDEPVAVFANHTCYMRLITYSFSAIQNVLPFVGFGVDTFWAYYATEGRLSFSEYKGHWPDFVIQESVVPQRELTDAFGRLAKPLVAQMRNNEEQSRTLATLRETLLPKLLSGEISVAGRSATLAAL